MHSPRGVYDQGRVSEHVDVRLLFRAVGTGSIPVQTVGFTPPRRVFRYSYNWRNGIAPAVKGRRSGFDSRIIHGDYVSPPRGVGAATLSKWPVSTSYVHLRMQEVAGSTPVRVTIIDSGNQPAQAGKGGSTPQPFPSILINQ